MPRSCLFLGFTWPLAGFSLEIWAFLVATKKLRFDLSKTCWAVRKIMLVDSILFWLKGLYLQNVWIGMEIWSMLCCFFWGCSLFQIWDFVGLDLVFSSHIFVSQWLNWWFGSSVVPKASMIRPSFAPCYWKSGCGCWPEIFVPEVLCLEGLFLGM